MIGYIYKITNLINNKVYIGQTSRTIQERWEQHIRDSQKLKYSLYLAINKYGINNFVIEQIEECPISLLNEKEIYWIKYYNSYKEGYNENLGGGGNQKYNQNDIINLWESGHSCKEIMEICGCSTTTLTEILNKYNINKEERKARGNEKRANGSVDNLIKDFYDGMSINKIALKYKTSFNRVKKRLIENGITLEEIEKNRKNALKTSGIKREIEQYDLNYNLLNIFPSIKEAKIFLGKKENNTKLNHILKHDKKYHLYDNFYWKYAE